MFPHVRSTVWFTLLMWVEQLRNEDWPRWTLSQSGSVAATVVDQSLADLHGAITAHEAPRGVEGAGLHDATTYQPSGHGRDEVQAHLQKEPMSINLSEAAYCSRLLDSPRGPFLWTLSVRVERTSKIRC